MPGETAVAGLAFLYAFSAIAGSGRDPIYWGFLMLVAGIPVYAWILRGRPAAQRLDRTDSCER